jgi:hypothetical protein
VSREGGASQLVLGEKFYMQEWDLENLNTDLDDPGGGLLKGEMSQGLGMGQCTNVPNFGFIPLHDNEIVQGPVNQQIKPQQLWGKKLVSEVDLHNYNSYRVPVDTGFNVDKFQELASNYGDQQLFELLRFGFPLDITKEFTPVTKTVNHTSAVKFPEAVSEFIKTELKFGGLEGPINAHEYSNLHISPLMSRPKEGGARRIIVDLSWPKAEAASVNDGVLENRYLNCDFTLKLPTVDHICRIVKAFEGPVLLYKMRGHFGRFR